MSEQRHRFEVEVLPHLDAAYRFARWLARTPADADDIVQEAILRAFRSFETLRGTEVKAWLMAIVRNCHSTALQKAHRRQSVPIPEEDDARDGHFLLATGPGPEGETIQSDAQRTMDRLLSALPADYREVLVLREIEEMGYREIATAIDIPIGTVMSRLARARAALKKQWLLQGESRVAP